MPDLTGRQRGVAVPLDAGSIYSDACYRPMWQVFPVPEMSSHPA